MVTETSQGDPPGIGGKSQKSFIGRTLQQGGIPTSQGENEGAGGIPPRNLGEHKLTSPGLGELLVGTAGSPQNWPQLGGQEGLWGGSVASLCVGSWTPDPEWEQG